MVLQFLPFLIAAVFLQAFASISFAGRFYVSDDVGPGGDGSSWDTAFTFLQDALDQTVAGRGDEIWIEAGTYVIAREDLERQIGESGAIKNVSRDWLL